MKIFTLFSLFHPILVIANTGSHESYVERNFRTIKSIYNLTVYPNNLPILNNLTNAVPPGLFDPNVTGRVTPVGSFGGLLDSLEYFYLLAIPIPPTYVAFTNSTIVEFSSGCPEVAASTVYLETSRIDPQRPQLSISTLKEITFWRFDEQGAVVAYDAWIPNLSAWVANANGFDPYTPAAQNETIYEICLATQERCIGSNQVYDSLDQCVQTLATKPFGNYDETWNDNVVCRSIHVRLTASRPDINCPHVGPTGGGKCVDSTYLNKYYGDTELFGKSISELFTCIHRY